MNAPRIVNFDLDKIHGIAQTAINRASVFAKMSAAAKFSLEDINDAGEDKFNRLAVVGPIPENMLPEHMKNFQEWIRLNAVRELIEGFYLYIDGLLLVFDALSHQSKQKISVKDFEEITQGIKQKPGKFDAKLKKLTDAYKVEIPKEHRQYIEFIEQMRHCASHNCGIVDPRHFTHQGSGNTARVEWLTIAFEVITPDGKKKKVKQGAFVEGGSSIGIRFTKAFKEIPYGSYLALTVDEVERIAFTMWLVVQNITKQLNGLTKQFQPKT